MGPSKSLLLGGSLGAYSDGVYSFMEFEGLATVDNEAVTYTGYEVVIPNGYFSQGFIELGFSATASVGHFGVDNLSISTKCSDPNAGRMLETAQSTSSFTPPALDPAEDGDVESYYCLSADYPCEGGDDHVHVCHYNARQGYRTFCIPEADSEVLRFYTNDYCGPCVGGFAGVQMN